MPYELNFSAVFERADLLILGVAMTIYVSILSMAVAVVLGLIVASMRMSKPATLQAAGRLYVRLFRGVPLYVYHKAAARALHAACDAAGVPRIRLHDLRHGRITRLLLAGVPVLYVSHQAGHSSVSFTMSKYGHVAVAPEAQRREWANA